MITVLSNGTNVLTQHVFFGRIGPGLSHRLRAEMFARKLAERTVPSRHDHRFRAVIRDELVIGVH